MSKNTLLVILICVIAAASFWFFGLRKDLKETQNKIDEQTETIAQRSRPITYSINSQPVASPEQVRQERLQEIDSLKQQLAVQQQNLTTLRRDITVKRQQQYQQRVQQRQDQTIAYQSQIRASQMQIQDMTDSLSDYGNREAGLSRQAAMALREQDSASRVALSQLDENIRVQENLIRQTQDNLEYWRLNYNDLAEQRVRLSELEPLLEAQKQQLADMRQQRLDISSNVLLQTRAIQSELTQNLDGLSKDRSSTEDEINSLRAEIQAIQDARNQARITASAAPQTYSATAAQTANPTPTELEQEQQRYNNLNEQVKALQDAIQKKEEELSTVR